MTRFQSTPAAIGLCAVLGLSLSACSNNSAEFATDVERDHPVQVVSRQVERPVTVNTESLELSPEDTAQLDRFVADFLQSGSGAIEISVPAGTGRDLALARANVIRSHVIARGVRPSEVQVRLSERSSDADAPLTVSYERYSVKLPECGNFSKPMSLDPRNLVSPNYGCSTQRNVAAMVSNPADLVRQRNQTPADAQRRSLVIQNYQQGKVTESEISEQAEAAGLTDIGN